jgi:hypothetical protein
VKSGFVILKGELDLEHSRPELLFGPRESVYQIVPGDVPH